MKVALVYDRINKWGGAERVLQALHELFPKAPLFTSVYDHKRAAWAKDFDVRPSFLQKLPFARSNHEYIPFLMPVAFEHFVFDAYDLVISLTSEAAKGIITKPQTKHLCYCLTPTRYLWSGYHEYLNTAVKKAIASPFVRYLRKWDKIAAHRPDYFVAASEEVKKRIKKYYDKDSEVIYPPTNLASNIERSASSPGNSKKPYFLVVSRFVPYKRIDLAVKACSKLQIPLKIIGSGREERKLRAMAGPSVEFVGKVTDVDLARYYQHCKALIFPGVEDFGLTVVEAQQFGRPVIAFRGGGAVETVAERKTGIFFNEQTEQSLMHSLQTFDRYHFNQHDCVHQAEKFSKSKFKEQFQSLVQRII